MIPILDLLLDLDLKLNKLASVDHQAIFNEHKIIALRQAQIKLLKKKINPNNIYQLGFDTFTKRYEDLQTLVVPYEKVLLVNIGDKLNGYSADITTLDKKYFLPVSMYALASKGCCIDRVMDISNIIKHADLPTTLGDSNWTPSFKYQETVAVISDNKIYLYSDLQNSFTLDSLYLSYLRYPKEMDIEGYIHLDGSSSTTVDCELVDYLRDELVDLAVQELAMSTENTNAVQYSQLRNKENE